MEDCPCGTGFSYIDCCAPLIRGLSQADTAEDLMRSRYTAFALNLSDYLKNSLHPDERNINSYSSEQQQNINWTKLEIVDIKKGEKFDEEGDVSFAAYFTQNGENKILKETSKFLKKNDQWFYSKRGSKVFSKVTTNARKSFQRKDPKIGRNAPCPCNSGKKFKKCCGK